jgi:hypothetical protein
MEEEEKGVSLITKMDVNHMAKCWVMKKPIPLE